MANGTTDGRNTNMTDFASLKNRIVAAVAITGRDDPYGLINQELTSLAQELGNLTTSRTAQVKFDLNGHKSVLSFEGLGDSSRFMLQTDQVSQKPFALCDAAEFARIIAVAHIPALCEMLLQENAKATEEVAHAIRTLRSVRDALRAV